MKTYLSVYILGHYNTKKKIKTGVPQGSALGSVQYACSVPQIDVLTPQQFLQQETMRSNTKMNRISYGKRYRS